MQLVTLKEKLRGRKGFSLLELLIYITILSLLLVVVSNTFISLSKGRGQAGAKSEVQNSIRFSTELLKQDIKNASAIITPSSIASSSTLTLTRDGVSIVYDVLAGVLRRKIGAASPVSVTNSNIFVDTATFTRIENTNTVFSTTNISIQIIMAFRYNATSTDWSYSDSLQTSVNLY